LIKKRLEMCNTAAEPLELYHSSDYFFGNIEVKRSGYVPECHATMGSIFRNELDNSTTD
jgi:Fe-S cluster biosynthesis and repair protein YggX